MLLLIVGRTEVVSFFSSVSRSIVGRGCDSRG